LNAAVSISGQRICRLAKEAAGAPDGESALRTLTLLRDELDEFERQQATRVLSRGLSYSQVARALGISRQAAHRRFRHLAPAVGEAAPGRLRASAEVRIAVGHAGTEARALGAAGVEPDHLLLGILRYDDERAAAALRSAGVTLEDSRREVAAAPWTPGAQAAGAATRHVLARAVGFARRERASEVHLDHLLRAVLEATDGGPGSLLRRLKVPARRVLDALEPEVCAPSPARAAG